MIESTLKRSQNGFEGLALTSPVSLGYTKQTSLGAGWFVGSALREMLKHSGLKKSDIDGFAVSSFSLGADTTIALTQHFGLQPQWLEYSPFGGASGLISMRKAARAVQAGDADIVACIGGDTAFHRSFEQTAAEFSSFSIDAAFPYGAAGPNAPFALIAQHYMERFKVSREQIGRISVAQRYNANHFPLALLGHKTLSMKQYMDARPIAGPLHLFDCVMPCAGAEGFLVMTEERAVHLNIPYCRILASKELHNSFPEDDVQYRGGWADYADALYAAAGVGPEDMDIAQTYDDYPVISMMQLEDLGFCAKGDAGKFVQETDLRFDGSGPETRKLAHNTSGGQLSVGQAGAAAGLLGVVESIRQLTGETLGQQVPNARHALVSGFGMINYDRGLCSGASILAAAKEKF